MPFTLDTPEEVAATSVKKYEITSFAIDLERYEIIVAYNKIDPTGKLIGEGILTIDGPDFPAAIAEASTVAGADVYAALKTALYNQISLDVGKGGAVT